MKTTAGRMANAATADFGLPHSLICDAWDILGRRDDILFASRDDFDEALGEALTEYEANPRSYRFNDASVLRFADTPVEPASISKAVIGVELTPTGEPVWTNV